MKLSSLLVRFGAACLIVGIGVILFTFFPIIKEELGYDLYRTTHKTPAAENLTPVDANFGIVIPKLGANARVIANVDPYNAAEYQYALTKGVAHAKGTALPGETGNIFLFSHSSVNFYVALQYNSVFYLIHKLTPGDEIDLYYHKTKFVYHVTGTLFVNPKDVSFLTTRTTEKTLTLMTCWPPGTTYERLLVTAAAVSP